jgi:hypothetical protein
MMHILGCLLIHTPRQSVMLLGAPVQRFMCQGEGFISLIHVNGLIVPRLGRRAMFGQDEAGLHQRNSLGPSLAPASVQRAIVALYQRATKGTVSSVQCNA